MNSISHFFGIAESWCLFISNAFVHVSVLSERRDSIAAMMDFLHVLSRVIRKIWLLGINLIFPQRCAGCGIVFLSLCRKCKRELDGLFLCGEVMVDEFRAFFASSHGNILKKVLHRFKYISDTCLAEALSGLLVKRLRSIRPDSGGGEIIIVPIPLHARRERDRGFNQSELLARLVAKEVGGVVMNVLVRERATEPQARLSRSERLVNVRGAFRVRKDFAGSLAGVPETVFVLDDVITTGSTFVECARVLKAAGVKRVYGIMLAHGL